MVQPAAGNLRNTGVLVTRPTHQSQHFIKMLQLAGAQVLACPSIEIQPLESTDSLQEKLQNIIDYQWLIFISANAVNYALKLVSPEQLKQHTIAAIGQSTAHTLTKYGLETSLQAPSGFTTEHLLELDDLQTQAITGKNILIFRGQGGREHLAQVLTERGARVDYAEVYRRTIPRTDIGPILDAWANDGINLVTVTSNQTLENLYHILGNRGQEFLNTTTLIVPGKRCYELARSKGHTDKIQIASSALDKDMFQAALDWHRANER